MLVSTDMLFNSYKSKEVKTPFCNIFFTWIINISKVVGVVEHVFFIPGVMCMVLDFICFKLKETLLYRHDIHIQKSSQR